MYKWSLMALFLAFFSAQAAQNLVAPAQNIVIDGKLNEAAWRRAPVNRNFSFLKNSRHGAQKPPQATEFQLLADRENIYIGIRCFEPDMASLRTSHHGPSGNSLWLDDLVEIHFAPTGQGDEYYHFVIGAGNGSWQMYYGEKGAIRPDAYAPIYEHQVYRGADFYSVEVKIPLTALYMTASRFMKSTWLFNVARQKAPAVWSSWAPLNSSFNEVAKFHRVGNFPVRRQANNIYIREVQAQLTSPQDGALQIKLQCEAHGAGNYVLHLTSAAGGTIAPHKVALQAGENVVTIPRVKFRQNGKVTLRLELLNAAGQLAAGRYSTVAVKFAPYALNLTHPGYKNCFFPGQDATRLKGNFTLNAAWDAVKIYCGSQVFTVPIKAPSVPFEVPLTWGKSTKLPVKFEFWQGQRVVAQERITLRKLAPTGRKMVWIDSGRLICNGRPFFALGWYGDNNWKTSILLQQRFPHCGDKHPLNFMTNVNLEPERLIAGTEAREAVHDVRPSPNLLAQVQARIEQNRDRDFDYYYLCDEPECRGVSPVYLKHLYNYIKALDPAHPVMIISREPGKYLDCADILNPHPYLNPMVGDDHQRVLKSEVDVIRRSCREIAQGGQNNKIIMLCPQVFSYAFCNNQADYPTWPETEASIWSAVAHGAQGITPFVWNAHMERPELYHGMDYIFTSLNRLMPFLTTFQAPLPCRSSNSWIDTRCLAWHGEFLLIIVNVSPQAQTTTIQLPSGVAERKLQVFREERSLNVGRELKLNLRPYQVMLLTSTPQDRHLPPWREVRQKMVQGETARRTRGNILFGRHKDIEISHCHCNYTYFTTMEQQDLLFDGNCEALAWQPHKYRELWYELLFPKFVPKFSKARIYGNGLANMKFKIWKFGAWREFPAQVKESRFCREYDFGKTLSTVKIRLEFASPPPGEVNRLELYEFELLK